MPDLPPRIRPLTVILLVGAGIFVAIGIVFFATSHPRRGTLFVVVAVAALFGAWFSTSTTRVR